MKHKCASNDMTWHDFKKEAVAEFKVNFDCISYLSVLCNMHSLLPEAQFLITDWGMKLAMASGCRTGQPAYAAGRAVTTTRRHSRLHPPVRD